MVCAYKIWDYTHLCRAYRHNYLAEYIGAHTYAHSSSHAIKALIVSLFFSLCCFPLPALSYLPYLLSLSSPMRPLSSTDKENRGGGKKEQQQGGMRRERRCGETLRQRAGRLIWDDTHIRRHTGAIVWWFCCGALWSHRLSLMNVWPLFLPPSSFHLLPTCLLMEEWLQGESKILLRLFLGVLSRQSPMSR